MENIASPFTGMLNGLFLGLSYTDFAMPIGMSLWALVFLFSFSRIDCSDLITAGAYVTFCSMTGVILVLVVPREFLSHLTVRDYLAWVFSFAIFSAIRWGRAYTNQTKKVEKYLEKGNEDGQ